PLGDGEPVSGTLRTFGEEACFHLTGEEEVAAEIEVHAAGGAARGANPRIRIDRGDPQADSNPRPEEEWVEEVVFEGDLPDPAEVGPLPREPKSPAALRATKLEHDLAHRFGRVKPPVTRERGNSGHDDQ